MNIPIHKHTPVRRHMSGYLIIISSRGASINKGAKRPVHTGTTKVRKVYVDTSEWLEVEREYQSRLRPISYECNPDETQNLDRTIWECYDIMRPFSSSNEKDKFLKLEKQFDKQNKSRWFRLFNRRKKK